MKNEICWERLSLLGIVVFFLTMSWAVLETVTPQQVVIEEEVSTSVHLPSKCTEFYNSGTEEWKECMLVEDK